MRVSASVEHLVPPNAGCLRALQASSAVQRRIHFHILFWTFLLLLLYITRRAVQVLVTLHRSVSLTFTPIEDATVGMWVAPLNVTRVNWEQVMLTGGWSCCFTRSTDRCAHLVSPYLAFRTARSGWNDRNRVKRLTFRARELSLQSCQLF